MTELVLRCGRASDDPPFALEYGPLIYELYSLGAYRPVGQVHNSTAPAARHHLRVGALGDAFELPSFMFRFFFGLVLFGAFAGGFLDGIFQ